MRLKWLLLLWPMSFTLALAATTYRNPVLPGDHPDPSIIRVGNEYWATATSSQWAPIFPIMRSSDLTSWKTVGAVFENPPSWSAGSYWAPEISQYRGRYFVYYTARKKDGPLCVAVAVALRPNGPYTDKGPLVCQAAGSIDAMAFTDEKHGRYLIWKEDGNSQKKPTPILAQKLSGDGAHLLGEPRELIRNDAPWEGELVEGPFILRREGWLYLFYSGAGCCGLKCNYALGVARARDLLGPWEKNPRNPILAGNDSWKCPGHGSIVQDSLKRDFLLYHAYATSGSVYTGRQGLLDEVKWNQDGWPVIDAGKGPSALAPAPLKDAQSTPLDFRDDFTTARLIPGWEWPWTHHPHYKIKDRWFVLETPSEGSTYRQEIVGVSAHNDRYVASVQVELAGHNGKVSAGLAAFGSDRDSLGIAAGGGKIELWKREKNQSATLASAPLASSRVELRLVTTSGHDFRFEYREGERDWTPLGAGLDGVYLPPWDLGIRIALTCEGPPGASAKFSGFRLLQTTDKTASAR